MLKLFRMEFPLEIHSGNPFNYLYLNNPFNIINDNLHINPIPIKYQLSSAFYEGIAMLSC